MLPTDLDIRLSPAPLDTAAAIARAGCPQAGAIAIFVGTTREENAPAAGVAPEPLLRLEYHAYEEMALRHLNRLASTAAKRWSVCRIVLWHRVGSVAVGEASVIIAVSTPHRAEAFAACQFLIDHLKQSVPIWKREIYLSHDHWQGA
jgi:molybdopterin synthase catalytic subunit